MNLRIYNFNNYYNRIIKFLNEDSEEFSDYIFQIENANFNPADNIMTEHIFGNNVTMYNGGGDYLVVTDTNSNIVSRWFIIEETRLRGGQWKLMLRRDVIVDFYDKIVTAPAFIEKAIVDFGDPALFNNEEMTFNQIKTKELPIRDLTQCPWIVGYIAKNTPATTITFTPAGSYTAVYETLEDVPFYSNIENDYIKTEYVTPTEVEFEYSTTDVGVDVSTILKINSYGNYSTINAGHDTSIKLKSGVTKIDYYSGKVNTTAADECKNTLLNNSGTIQSFIMNSEKVVSDNEIASFLETFPPEGRIVKIESTGKYYRLKSVYDGRYSSYTHPDENSEIFILLNNMINNTTVLRTVETGLNAIKNTAYKLYYKYNKYKIIREEVSIASASVQIPAPGARQSLIDAPYDMIAFPYNFSSSLSVTLLGNKTIWDLDPDISMGLAQSLPLITGWQNSGYLYDLQLLPYCPIPDVASTLTVLIDSEIYREGVDYSLIKRESEDIGIVLFPSRSSGSITIRKIYNQIPGDIEDVSLALPIRDAKVEAMCDMYRLVSPNYNGQFEFNAVKNEGVDYFNVDFTYKPYNPYIRVAPNFKGLYGSQFNDARGLICGGDFSLPAVTSAWTQYELNNKNYQTSFNREIQSLELNNKYQHTADIINAITGTATGAVSGAMTGAIAGGSIGAGIGAGVGGVASGVGGVADVKINEILRKDALDLRKDQFGYTLGNIRAMPYSLSRVSSFNINNKVFPILEYYTCTDIEKEALINKIKYNGMTIMRIGTFNEFIGRKYKDAKYSYIKGRLIRLEDLGDDFHIVNTIANELYEGVYV